MKKFLYLITLLPLFGVAIAQNSTHRELNDKQFKEIERSSFECLYRYTVEGLNQNDEEFCDEYLTILQAGENCAKFWDYGGFRADSIVYLANSTSEEIAEAQNNFMIQMFYFDSEVFQNIPKGRTTENGVIGLSYYTYNEKQEELQWTLSSDTQTIMETPCNKATAEFGGRVWTAWYAPSIPASYGPWKLSGLPGLILKASDNSGMHTFEAYSIRQNSLPIYDNTAKMRSKIAKAKYLKAKVIQEYNPVDVPVEAILNVEIQKLGGQTKMLINGNVVRLHPNGYHSLEVVELKDSEIPEKKLYEFPGK